MELAGGGERDATERERERESHAGDAFQILNSSLFSQQRGM